MLRFYATGTKQVTKQEVGESGKMEKVSYTTNVVIDLDPMLYGTRVRAVNEAGRVAKREKITLDGVYIMQGTQNGGGLMTKNAKQRRLERTQEHNVNRRKKLKSNR